MSNRNPLPRYCPICGEPLRREQATSSRATQQYRYYCTNPECIVTEVKHRRLSGDTYHLVPVYAAATIDQVIQ